MKRMLLALCSACIGTVMPAKGESNLVRVVVPEFSGQESIGKNVGSVLMLQVFTALRVPATGTGPRGQPQGAVALWHPAPIKNQGHDAAIAELATPPVGADIILWGNAYTLGSNVVVQSQLTLSELGSSARPPNEVWRVEVPTPEGAMALRADVPARRYSFDAFTLPGDLVERFRTPDLLQIFDASSGHGKSIGTLGTSFVALEVGAGTVKVRSSGDVVGWVRLPQLSTSRSDVVDFLNALVHVMRADCPRAMNGFERLVNEKNTRAEISRDSRLLMGMCEERQGKSALERFLLLKKEFPLSRPVATYLAMSQAAELERKLKKAPGSTVDLRARFAALIEEIAYLYPPEDAWYAQAQAIARALAKS